LVRADEEGAMTTIGFSTVERLPRLLLRLEGVAVAVAAMVVYFWAAHPWWLLLVLALAPDLSMAAYGAGPRIGAAAYDVVHTYTIPLGIGAIGVVAHATPPSRWP